MFAPNRRLLFLHRLTEAHELPQAGSPLTDRGFSLNLSGECALRSAEIRRTHGRGKRVDTYGFYPLNSRFPLFLSLAQIADM